MGPTKVNVGKIFGIKYKSGLIQTEVLNNFPVWRNETFKKADAQRGILTHDEWVEFYKKEVNCLLLSRVEELKNVFGKQDFNYRGEYNMFAWVVESGGCEAIIFSGKGKGTSVEIILNEGGRPKGSVEGFFKAYKELMQSF